MNDTYYELLVPQKKQNLTWLFLSVLLGLLALAGLLLSVVFPLSWMASLVIGGLTYYFVLPRIRQEFEYSMLNSELTIDVIYNKTNRKTADVLDVRNATLICPVTSPQMHNLSQAVKKNYASGQAQEDYAMVIPEQGRTTVFLFTPDQHLLDMIRRYAPRALQN